MTFTELVTVVTDYCNLSSSDAVTRVGKTVNRHYRRITASLGLDDTRFVTRSVSTTNGQQYVTFTEIEKIDRILDATDSTAFRVLTQVSIDTQRTTQPGTSEPCTWALRNTDADSVTILLDTLPQTTYSLQADGTTTVSALSGSDEPVFPESYHDILSWYAISEEMLRKEKGELATEYRNRADQLLAELRFYLADSPSKDTRQAATEARAIGAAGGGGGGTIGGTAYTQTALLTFDRGSGNAPFAVQQSNAAKVDNLDADKLDGFSSAAFAMVDGSQPFANTGLQVLDTNASHELIIKPGSNITAERTLTLTTGDADRTITLSGNPTLADWFDQSVKVAATPTFSTLSLSGGQLAFPASQNASADANTLDDYEEGTWTPSVGGNATYGANNGGRYTKIGRVVHIQGYLHINVIGTGSTTTISGLPFASALDTGIAVGYFASLASNVVFVAAYLTGSVVTFASIAAAAASLTSASALIGSSTTIYFNGSYVV